MESLYQDDNLLINSSSEGFILNHKIVADTYMKYMHMVRMNIISTQAMRTDNRPLDVGKLFKVYRTNLSNSIKVTLGQFEIVVQELVDQGILLYTEKEGCSYFEPTLILNAIHALDKSMNDLTIDALRSHYFLVSSLFSLLLTGDDRLALLMYGSSWNSIHYSNIIDLSYADFIEEVNEKITLSPEIRTHLVSHINRKQEWLLPHVNTLLEHLGEPNFTCAE